MVAALGQAYRGDDAVGPMVLERLDGLRCVRLAEPSLLVDLLPTVGRVVLVDAVVDGGPPGRVLVLDEAALAEQPLMSSHGISVPQAIGLARALSEDCGEVVCVGITIAPPGPIAEGLSPEVEAVIAEAAQRVREIVDA